MDSACLVRIRLGIFYVVHLQYQVAQNGRMKTQNDNVLLWKWFHIEEIQFH